MRKRIVIMLLVLFLTISLSLLTVNAVDRSSSTWVPSWGSASARNGSYSGSVRMFMDFGWDTEYSISGLMADTNETLEMDLMFYNYDGEGYVTYYYGDDTYGVYWETNQPRPYHDTDFDDNENEPALCIGCSDANLYEVDQYYYWWCYGVKNSDGGSAEVAAQRGYRSPSGIYESCWNVFAEQTIEVVGYADFDVPGSVSW